MLKSNEEILEHLELTISEIDHAEFEHLKEEDRSLNASMVKEYLSQWNKTDAFPINELKRYIRFNEWTYKDFDFENELIVQDVLPDWCHDIFFKVKKFRENRRNELTSNQFAFSKLMGYKSETQDEKAYVVYDYAYQKFYNNSRLHGGQSE